MSREARTRCASRVPAAPIAGILLLFGALASPPAAFGVAAQCMNLGQGNSCIANDFVQINLSTTIVGGDTCLDGEIDLQFVWDVTGQGGNTRYDIGFWVPTDGGNPQGAGQCEKNAQLVSDAVWAQDDDDACRDLEGGEQGFYTQTATVACVDVQAPLGTLDDPLVCLSWDNQDDDDNCNSDSDVVAGTSSKCQCVFADASEVTFPSCGDNTVDPGEQCDDGNNDNGDGCSAICVVEVPTLGEWGQILLAIALLGIGALVLRRKTRTA